MKELYILGYEANWLTEDNYQGTARSIRTEFDFIRLCQGMMDPFGVEAREILDRFIALSLRKLLCDDNSILKAICPSFKMPPLSGDIFKCEGENHDLKLVEIHTDIHIKPQNEWVPLSEWLDTTIAYIEKGIDDIPDAYDDRFFQLLKAKLDDRDVATIFEPKVIDNVSETKTIWEVKDPSKNKEKLYSLLKDKGYYDLSIRRMIKHIADKQGAHIDSRASMWISVANTGKDYRRSAISVFATHMIYAATKQIKDLEDYYPLEPLIETL
ncbi:hypothetical protein SAMN02910292_00890 [Lachnospiraceae bacterium XBB2008]|nr:hypothetical protein SAMN02910292_00890 [Lachnospiraceae bacterium XBB2008]